MGKLQKSQLWRIGELLPTKFQEVPLVSYKSTIMSHWRVETREGGTRIWLDSGVPLEPQNPYPSVRVILTEKGTHFFTNLVIFEVFDMRKPKNLGSSQKIEPTSKDLKKKKIVKNGTCI